MEEKEPSARSQEFWLPALPPEAVSPYARSLTSLSLVYKARMIPLSFPSPGVMGGSGEMGKHSVK